MRSGSRGVTGARQQEAYRRIGTPIAPGITTCFTPQVSFLQHLKSDWRELERDSPGKRFQHRYERKHEGSRGGPRLLTLSAGVLVLAAGLFFLPAPGPGLIIVLLGAALLAQESLGVARLLDRAEILVRDIYAAAVRLWKRASVPARIAMAVGAALVVACLAWAAYFVIFLRD
jgi:hypothetical protein